MGGTVSQPETMSAQHAQQEVAVQEKQEVASEQEVAVTEQEVAAEATSTREAEMANKLRVPFYTLTDDLKPIAYKWNTFGVYLDIDDGVLETIEANVNKGDVGKVDYCFKSTLRQWLKSDNSTKTGLCSALKNIGEKELARRLEADTEFKEPFKLRVLLGRLHTTRPKWHELGVQLHIDADTLKAFEVHNGNVVRCLEEVLQVWSKRPGASVSSILEALRSDSVGEKKFADRLEKAYEGKGYMELQVQNAEEEIPGLEDRLKALPESLTIL